MVLLVAREAWFKEMSKLPRMWEVDVTLGHRFRGSAMCRKFQSIRGRVAFRVSLSGGFGTGCVLRQVRLFDTTVKNYEGLLLYVTPS